MDLRNHRLFRLNRKSTLSRSSSMSTPSLGPFEAVTGSEMVSRRRILSRSRDNLSQTLTQEEEEDVWYQKDKLYKEHIQEVLDKWTQIDDEIWAKVIVFEKNRRVAKAYARAPVLTINGSDDGFDGMRIGLCGFDNPHRDQKTDELKRHVGQGVKIKMDDAGNILIRRYSKSSVFVKSTAASSNEETAIGQDILKLPGYSLEQEKIFKLFDMKKFQSNVNRELRRAYPDRRRLETQCLSAVAFVKSDNELLECPIWVLVINVVAMDMLKSKLPPIQRPMDIKNRPRIPIPDEDPYSIASSNVNGSGSSGSSGGYGLGNGHNGHGVVAATREQLMMQMGQRRGERPPNLPPRENGYGPADIPKPDYDDIEANGRGPAQFPRGKSDKGKEKKYDDPYYCGLRARVPNFVKANGAKVLPTMTERLTLKEVPVPSKRFSVAHPHGAPYPPHPHMPPAALWHARSYESGIDGDHYDPYALYGRLPVPGRGFPPPPAPHARHMFIGDWD
ncbi:uncharacterized protein LOC114242833 isoform X1 [Bombyx mandarina]|uniref:MH2 domain-containing protein n=4 Tax=Bombyx TaxID=7090 RepID=A0A8R1WJE6_BOMMO|nr:uncharacterized protein LOC101737074 isoform X1 [Bombyx mori]XP_028029916.1 uncharacterized protein LOC114242833 isoform X1 [Bombyx mandarina]